MPAYLGRFAPSPTGQLHQGSLVAALACALDASVHQGRWLLRIEDIDPPREQPGAATRIIQTLRTLGFQWHGEIVYQSLRHAQYQAAFERLSPLCYPCICSRKDIAARQPRRTADGENIYPGTCAAGITTPAAGVVKHPAWRLRLPEHVISFTDRWAGIQQENLAHECGDIVLKRADGLWAYHLAVVVDDIDAGVTHIVRGADLLHSTPRQLFLYECLKAAAPEYLHVPLVTHESGQKLSKQNQAAALDIHQGLSELEQAARHLGLVIEADSLRQFWRKAPAAWERRLKSLPS
ncbi:MAG: tRNA glutamyl-Q(34) synthetase GluQRS [Burkholderiales bacterium]